VATCLISLKVVIKKLPFVRSLSKYDPSYKSLILLVYFIYTQKDFIESSKSADGFKQIKRAIKVKLIVICEGGNLEKMVLCSETCILVSRRIFYIFNLGIPVFLAYTGIHYIYNCVLHICMYVYLYVYEYDYIYIDVSMYVYSCMCIYA
jgi:hypothetical protein